MLSDRHKLKCFALDLYDFLERDPLFCSPSVVLDISFSAMIQTVFIALFIWVSQSNKEITANTRWELSNTKVQPWKSGLE